ncbi:MAG: HD-like signal output (HDOD) protein [Planctomycetota bacterium]|jgi:HD-like signal output (HDOD) protein
MFDLDDITKQADQLEPLSASASRLLSIFSRDDWEPEEVIEVVALDEALTGRVLRLANSASMTGHESASSVDAAVIRLGMGAVMSTAMATSMRSNLDTSLPAYELGDGAIWRHSVTSAIVAEGIHKACRGRISQEIQTASLLHDIGKLLIARNIDEDEAEMMGRARNEGNLDWSRAEREILMVNHCDLGAIVAQHWSLPDSIVQAILFHHDPEQTPGDDSVRSIAFGVQLANIGAHRIDDEPDFGEDTIESALSNLQLSQEAFEQVLEASREKLDEVLGCYS